MATTLILITIESICKKYNITPEQFSLATKIVANGRKAFYIVESASVPGQEYRVEWNNEHYCLQCRPHKGKVCKASEYGLQCWHKRAALAVEEYEQARVRAQRRQEQASIEATKEYQFEQLFRDLEDALANLDRIAAKADEWEQSRRDADRTAYNYYELSLGII